MKLVRTIVSLSLSLAMVMQPMQIFAEEPYDWTEDNRVCVTQVDHKIDISFDEENPSLDDYLSVDLEGDYQNTEEEVSVYSDEEKENEIATYVIDDNELKLTFTKSDYDYIHNPVSIDLTEKVVEVKPSTDEATINDENGEEEAVALNEEEEIEAYSENSTPSIKYSTHIQDIGWQSEVNDGQVSGTTGKSKRLEGIKLSLSGANGGITYSTHIQDIGWQGYKSNGELSGTSGQSKRLEAIVMYLTGDIANEYDIYYRVHAENFGWMDWACNGQRAGTQGYSYRLEAIEVQLVKKGESAPGKTNTPFKKKNGDSFECTGSTLDKTSIEMNVGETKTFKASQSYAYWGSKPNMTIAKSVSGNNISVQESSSTSVQNYNGTLTNEYTVKANRKGKSTITLQYPDGTTKKVEVKVVDPNSPTVTYSTHIQDIGWQTEVSDGQVSGTTGKSKRLEGIKLSLSGANGGITYSTHIQDIGWQGYKSNGELSGTSGQSKRLEAIVMYLTGDIANEYDIYYRVHAENFGWMDWACNGQRAGTQGYSYRLEAIEVQLVKKGESAPGKTNTPFKKKNGDSFECTGSTLDKTSIEMNVGETKTFKASQSYAYWGSKPNMTIAKSVSGNNISVQESSSTSVQNYNGTLTNEYTVKANRKGKSTITLQYPDGTTKKVEVKVVDPNSPTVTYSTHIQDIGWQTEVSDGQTSGTIGQSKRLEGIKISVEGVSGNIEYQTHVQDIGWMSWVSNGKLSGTSGQSKRLEAIRIKLSGQIANDYDVYYRVHAQDYGWLGWTKNGDSAGTEGLNKRLESIEICILKKGDTSITTSTAFIGSSKIGGVSVNTYSDSGWSGNASNNMKGVKFTLNTSSPYFGGDLQYSAHFVNSGWSNTVSNGTELKNDSILDAIKISLTGEISKYCDVYYRTYVDEFGWLGWAKNGQVAGSNKINKSITNIEVKVVLKDASSGLSNSMYYIESMSKAMQKAHEINNQLGRDLRKAFDYAKTITYSRYVPADTPSYGSENYANQGFDNHVGNCYVMSAVFCYLAKDLGYDAHQIGGQHSSYNTTHSWVEIEMNGTTYVFDPDFEVELHRNGYMFTYGTSGTLRYHSYSRMN